MSINIWNDVIKNKYEISNSVIFIYQDIQQTIINKHTIN